MAEQPMARPEDAGDAVDASSAGGVRHVDASPASWPLRIPSDARRARVDQLQARIAAAADASQYGWGHTIDFGPFTQDGLLGTVYLDMVGAIDALAWWPARLDGQVVADVGAFTGGVAAILASRGASRVYAVDEIAEHLDQCRLVAEAFDLEAIHPVRATLYRLDNHVAAESLDYLFLGGVLYHLSDMLVGLMLLRELLKPDAWLILETNAVECGDHSYANFGRFYAGMWWQPSALCVLDLLAFAGYSDAEITFYRPGRALARARRGPAATPPFTRGLTIQFESLRDAVDRRMEMGIMAPAPDGHPDVETSSQSESAARHRGPGWRSRLMRRLARR